MKHEGSANEVSFNTRDVLEVLRGCTGDSWLLARRDGLEGDIPESLVKLVKASAE
jgi:hypothetical protein